MKTFFDNYCLGYKIIKYKKKKSYSTFINVFCLDINVKCQVRIGSKL